MGTNRETKNSWITKIRYIKSLFWTEYPEEDGYGD